jgi:hypothetical protein
MSPLRALKLKETHGQSKPIKKKNLHFNEQQISYCCKILTLIRDALAA